MQEERVEVLEAAGAETPASTSKTGASPRVRSVVRFVGLFALLWVLFDVCYEALPMIRPGADVVMDAKYKTLVKGQLFLPADRYRVLVFGNSKTMAGFRPEEFDDVFGDTVRSYNLGLPGEPRFLPILKAALEAGNVPTHVLLTIPWDDKPKPTLLDWLRDDETLIYTLIPFRDLPRDVAVFTATSHLHFKQKYAEAVEERDKMLAHRGWYYIKAQSFFPSGELPEDYSIPTDQPDEFLVRQVPDRSYILAELNALAARYHFQVVLIPGNMRYHAEAAAPKSDEQRSTTVAGGSGFRVIGPDYWVYPPADYADPVHLNPKGASAYTHDLATLITRSGVFN